MLFDTMRTGVSKQRTQKRISNSLKFAPASGRVPLADKSERVMSKERSEERTSDDQPMVDRYEAGAQTKTIFLK